MKKIIFFIVILVLTNQIVAQDVYKYRAKEAASKLRLNGGDWNSWSDWKECNILVVFDLEREKVSIYSETLQEFDIIKMYPEEKDPEGVLEFKFYCVDQDGSKCNLRQRFIKSNRFSCQLYIDYNNLILAYNLEKN